MFSFLFVCSVQSSLTCIPSSLAITIGKRWWAPTQHSTFTGPIMTKEQEKRTLMPVSESWEWLIGKYFAFTNSLVIHPFVLFKPQGIQYIIHDTMYFPPCLGIPPMFISTVNCGTTTQKSQSWSQLSRNQATFGRMARPNEILCFNCWLRGKISFFILP